MTNKEAIERLKEHREYLQLEHDRGCTHTILLEALDIAIKTLEDKRENKRYLNPDAINQEDLDLITNAIKKDIEEHKEPGYTMKHKEEAK